MYYCSKNKTTSLAQMFPPCHFSYPLAKQRQRFSWGNLSSPIRFFKAKWPELSYFGRRIILAAKPSLYLTVQALGDIARSSICYSAFPSGLTLSPVLIKPERRCTEPSLNINHCRTVTFSARKAPRASSPPAFRAE